VTYNLKRREYISVYPPMNALLFINPHKQSSLFPPKSSITKVGLSLVTSDDINDTIYIEVLREMGSV